jgi:hypothetical protein
VGEHSEDRLGADQPHRPDPQPGAAPITLRTYTHLMPEALEEARRETDAWLVARLEKDGAARSSSRLIAGGPSPAP